MVDGIFICSVNSAVITPHPDFAYSRDRIYGDRLYYGERKLFFIIEYRLGSVEPLEANNDVRGLQQQSSVISNTTFIANCVGW